MTGPVSSPRGTGQRIADLCSPRSPRTQSGLHDPWNEDVRASPTPRHLIPRVQELDVEDRVETEAQHADIDADAAARIDDRAHVEPSRHGLVRGIVDAAGPV